MSKRAILIMILTLIIDRSSAQTDYTGNYQASTSDLTLVVSLRQHADGSVEGQLTSEYVSLAVSGVVDANGVTAVASADGLVLGLFGRLNEDQSALTLQLYEPDAGGYPDPRSAQTVVLLRTRETPNVAAAHGPAATSGVFVNGQPMSRQALEALAQRYGTRVPDGRFWYDARSGAWGVEGGPAAGFILPGIDLPGPMPVGISGGGTGIIINGREIHPQDQMALRQLLGVTYPGSYWMDAQGNLGAEGGPILVNLVQVARSRAGTQYGSVYSEVGNTRSTLASDGNGGFMFMSSDGTSYYTGQ